MLGSLGSSSHKEEDDPSPSDHIHHHRQIHQHGSFTSPAIRMRQLLISCAELISSRSDPSSAHRLLAILMANSNPFGDSTERLIHHFTRALSLRLSRCNGHDSTTTTTASTTTAAAATTTGLATFFITTTSHDPATTAAASTNCTTSIINQEPLSPLPNIYSNQVDLDHQALVQSSYLSLNQVTPFIRFSQLTANQAILEAIEGQASSAVHILDFDIMHGLQWPPFMQAIVGRSPRPSLRITGTGNDLETLRKTGDRLAKFANSLDLRFQFHPLLILNEDDPLALSSAVVLLPGETLAVNCVHYLHRLLKNRDGLRLLLHGIKLMSPAVVTVAEREANHNHPVFQQRFVEALDHYAAVFDSLEATLPSNSQERLNVEQFWFGREIVDIVVSEGDRRKERHERFRSWELMMRSSGFNIVALSPFALSQAKLLLRLHYPSEGYQLHILNDALFLGWQNQPLFSVSSWRY